MKIYQTLLVFHILALNCLADTLQFKSGKVYQCDVLTFEEGSSPSYWRGRSNRP